MLESKISAVRIKFLVIQTAFLGDAILATSIIEKLHDYEPTAEIDFLVRKGNEGLFDHHPFLNEVLVWDKKNGKTANLLELIWQIRRSGYDYVINCHRHFSSGLITVLSGAKITSGFRSNPLSFLFTKKATHNFDGNHEIQRNQRLISFITDDFAVKPKLYPVENFGFPISNSRFITISPASVWYTKQYPKEKWAAFIKKVPAYFDIYLLGGPPDSNLSEEIILLSERKSGIYNQSGKLSYLESASLMKNATLNYVNDSAPMHLSSAVNAPVCVVYCSTIPAFGYGPLSDVSCIIEINEKLNCRPCGLHGHKVCPEGHFRCANEISDLKLLDILNDTLTLNSVNSQPFQ